MGNALYGLFAGFAPLSFCPLRSTFSADTARRAATVSVPLSRPRSIDRLPAVHSIAPHSALLVASPTGFASARLSVSRSSKLSVLFCSRKSLNWSNVNFRLKSTRFDLKIA